MVDTPVKLYKYKDTPVKLHKDTNTPLHPLHLRCMVMVLVKLKAMFSTTVVMVVVNWDTVVVMALEIPAGDNIHNKECCNL